MRKLVRSSLLLGALLLGAPLAAQDEGPRPRPTPPPKPAEEEPPVPPDTSPVVPAPDVAPPEGVEHFPLHQGRRWTYRMSFHIEPASADAAGEPAAEPGGGEHRLDVYVTEPQRIEDVPVATLEWKLDQELSQRSYFVVREGYLRCVKRLQGFGEHVKDFTLAPAQPVVPEKLEVGQSWGWEGKAGPGAGKQAYKVLRQESVETPAGTFQATVIEARFEGDDDSRGTQTRWLAPGVGIVKEVSEVRTAVQVFKTEAVLVRYDAP